MYYFFYTSAANDERFEQGKRSSRRTFTEERDPEEMESSSRSRERKKRHERRERNRFEERDQDDIGSRKRHRYGGRPNQPLRTRNDYRSESESPSRRDRLQSAIIIRVVNDKVVNEPTSKGKFLKKKVIINLLYLTMV